MTDVMICAGLFFSGMIAGIVWYIHHSDGRGFIWFRIHCPCCRKEILVDPMKQVGHYEKRPPQNPHGD